ncbi:MAG: hypothetical protein ACK2UL_06895 [Anaerolineae bacterium]
MGQRRRYHPRDFGDVQWRLLLDFALERCDAFECAIPYRYIALDLANAPLWPAELETLRGDVVGRHVSMIRRDVLQEYATQYVRFRSTSAVRRYVRSLPRLEDWSWPDGTPEDPLFVRGDSTILSTESPAGRITVYADNSDIEDLSDVGIQLIEPLDVKAEPWPTP